VNHYLNLMKKIILLSFIALFLFVALSINEVGAISGACSWHGGVNCAAGADWDGSVICNDGWKDSSVSYSSMVKCQGYYNYDYPSYTPSIPDCPFNSYYDSLSDSCKCYSGYVVSGGKCISTSQYCRDLLGWNARYNILTDKCECSYGYILSGGRCVDGDTLCHQQYGFHSNYDSFTEKCKCSYGYVFNSNNQCVNEDDYCQDLYGYYAEHDILTDKCICKRGYVFNTSMTKCIDGNTYCRDKYGFHVSYDYWDEKCECDTGYVFSNNKCVGGDTYCQNLYGSHSSYSSLMKNCECDYGYKLKDDKCITPKISKIFPLNVKIGEEITIQGEYFGDSRYGNLKLYVGFVKVNSLDIFKWQDNKIIFEIGDYLESGYVILKDETINIRGSYLEILETKEDHISNYSFMPPPKEKSTTEPEFQPSDESRSKTEHQSELGSQLQKETQSELQRLTEKPQPPGFQEPKKEDQQEINIKEEQGEEKDQKKFLLASISESVVNVFISIKNFFYRIFH